MRLALGLGATILKKSILKLNQLHFRFLKNAREYFQFRNDALYIWVSEYSKNKNDRFYSNLLRIAAKNGDPAEETELLGHMFFEDQSLNEGIADARSRLSIKQARRFYIPEPEKEDDIYWESNSIDKERLSEKGVIYLQSRIRKEKKERLELKLLWLTGITGVVGTVTGLAAVILSHLG